MAKRKRIKVKANGKKSIRQMGEELEQKRQDRIPDQKLISKQFGEIKTWDDAIDRLKQATRSVPDGFLYLTWTIAPDETSIKLYRKRRSHRRQDYTFTHRGESTALKNTIACLEYYLVQVEIDFAKAPTMSPDEAKSWALQQLMKVKK